MAARVYEHGDSNARLYPTAVRAILSGDTTHLSDIEGHLLACVPLDWLVELDAPVAVEHVLPGVDPDAFIHAVERRMFRMFEHGKSNNTASAQTELQAMRTELGWTGVGAANSPATLVFKPMPRS